MNLSPRLNQLKAFIKQPYDNIWDGCCDHGLLGQSLLPLYPSTNLHFVDINGPIIDSLSNRLSRSQYKNWQTYCLDASDIEISPRQSHLIILAGIGGQLMQRILETLLRKIRQHKHANVAFLLSPIHHQFHLRAYLCKENFFVVSEKLIEDNGRFYEIMHVTLSGHQPISDIGESLWESPTHIHQAYLKRLIEHYQRVSLRDPNNGIPILKRYQKIAESMRQCLPCEENRKNLR